MGDHREPQSLQKNSHSPVCPGTCWNQSKTAAQSIKKGTFASHPAFLHTAIPILLACTRPLPLRISPHCPSDLFYCVPRKRSASSQSGDTPALGPLFTRNLHSKPPLWRGKLGLCLLWKVPGTVYCVPCSVEARHTTHECPESSPASGSPHSCLSLCFLIYESQLGWFLSLFPVHKLLLLLAWSSENLLELVVKVRGFGECGSTGILGTFRPSQGSGKKKKKKSPWWTFLEEFLPKASWAQEESSPQSSPY